MSAALSIKGELDEAFSNRGAVSGHGRNGASAQVNAGEQKSDPNLPFTVTQVTTLSLPWKIAFLPDGRMLITEKVGGLWLVTQQGEKTPVANIPAVLWRGQGGMLGVYALAALCQGPLCLPDLFRAG